jgi:sulfate adenylyltransferase subunit 1
MNATGLLKFITCGSVDDGKSTLIGHILYDSKLLYTDQEQALLLDSQVGSRGGQIDYSLLLDGLLAEREQGITIDVAYRYFTTEQRSFIVADTPGHEEYTRNMAVGASFADLAVILVDASQGVLLQTRRHARICAMMGIRYFVFAVNKMDLIGFAQAPFQAIVEDIAALKNELLLKNIAVIPLSATEGDNVTKLSPRIPWYEGPALLTYLETVDTTEHTREQGFYTPIQRVCRPDHTFRGFQGQIESGSVQVGDQVTALPSRETAVVKSILVGGLPREEAHSGQPVTIQLDREVDLSRGCVLEKNAGLTVAKTFAASLLWMDDRPLVPGKDYLIKIGARLLPAAVTGIRYRTDINSGERLPASLLEKNEIALCDITLAQFAVQDAFYAHKTVGELILIDRVSHATSACGVIERLEKPKAEGAVLADDVQQITLRIFSDFYYHPDTHTVVRHTPQPAFYRPGDPLPLKGAGYHYPPDFDISAGPLMARIRAGKFAGFGPREETVPLINADGLRMDSEPALAFAAYHTIPVWDEATAPIEFCL